MIRAIIFCTLSISFILLNACKNDPKPQTTANPTEQLDPELAALNSLLEKQPENDSLLYQRGAVYFNLEGYDEALKDLGNAIRLDSLQPPYYHLMAEVFLEYGRPNDSRRALEVLQTAARLFPDDISTLLKLSKYQLIVQQHNEALTTLDGVLRREPQNAEAYFMAGRVALDMKDTVHAINMLKKSAQFNSDNALAWRFLGRIYSEKNNPLAIQYFDNALRVDSTDLATREFKAMFYKRRGEFDQAFAVYRDIIVRNPDYSNAYFDVGMIYLELDSMQKAYDHFNISIKTDPLFVMAYYYRGLTAELMGNREAALADYRQANKMSPDYPEAKEALQRLEK
jgi:tetratricopeptide (TPR) repeat protein